jgi:hypothetical protein
LGLLLRGITAGKSLGEVTISTLAGPWRMVGASAAKQCCSKQCCLLGAADAIGAMRTAIAAATAATTIRRPIATSSFNVSAIPGSS